MGRQLLTRAAEAWSLNVKAALQLLGLLPPALATLFQTRLYLPNWKHDLRKCCPKQTFGCAAANIRVGRNSRVWACKSELVYCSFTTVAIKRRRRRRRRAARHRSYTARNWDREAFVNTVSVRFLSSFCLLSFFLSFHLHPDRVWLTPKHINLHHCDIHQHNPWAMPECTSARKRERGTPRWTAKERKKRKGRGVGEEPKKNGALKKEKKRRERERNYVLHVHRLGLLHLLDSQLAWNQCPSRMEIQQAALLRALLQRQRRKLSPPPHPVPNLPLWVACACACVNMAIGKRAWDPRYKDKKIIANVVSEMASVIGMSWHTLSSYLECVNVPSFFFLIRRQIQFVNVWTASGCST